MKYIEKFNEMNWAETNRIGSVNQIQQNTRPDKITAFIEEYNTIVDDNYDENDFDNYEEILDLVWNAYSGLNLHETDIQKIIKDSESGEHVIKHLHILKDLKFSLSKYK